VSQKSNDTFIKIEHAFHYNVRALIADFFTNRENAAEINGG